MRTDASWWGGAGGGVRSAAVPLADAARYLRRTVRSCCAYTTAFRPSSEDHQLVRCSKRSSCPHARVVDMEPGVSST